MYHKFFVKGYGGEPYQMKSAARRASHRVAGCEDAGLDIGLVRFEYHGRVYRRDLTKREAVFGMAEPRDRHGGGFAGLVMWQDGALENACVIVSIDMARSGMTGADEWIVDFVRAVICEAGWVIIREELKNGASAASVI